MTIKNQFVLTLSIFGLILIGMAASLLLTSREIERLDQQVAIADRIEQGAVDLSYIAGDYLMYGESQQSARWETRFVSFSEDLAQLIPATPEQQAHVDSIRTDQARLQAVFADVVATIERAASTSASAPDPAISQASWSRVAAQNQAIASEAAQLSGLLHEQAELLERFNLNLILALIAAFGAYLLVTVYLIYQRILRSLADLQAGTAVVGSGCLDFIIAVKRADEIGQLASAFNQMTRNLKAVTASKAELEREIAGRNEIEAKLRESERRYRELIQHAPAGIYELDFRTRRFSSVNDVMCELTGYTRQELLNMSPFDILDADSQVRFRARMQKWLAGEKPEPNVEYRVHAKDGHEICALLNVTFTRDADGAAVGATVVGYDITERKRLEAQVQAIADKYSLIFDTTSDGVWIHNLKGEIVEVNDAYCRLSGYSRDELIHMPVSALEAAESPVEIAAHIQKLIESGGHDRFESRHRRKDGSIFNVDITALYLETDGGRIAVFVRDVTERKRAETALRESEQRYRGLFEHMAEGLAYCQVIFENDTACDWIYLAVNDAFEALTGLKGAAGKRVSEVLPGLRETDPALFDIYGRVALTGRPEKFEMFVEALQAWFSVSVYSPETGYFTAVFDVITERKQAEEARRRAHDELEMRVRERTAQLMEANAVLEEEIEERKRAEDVIHRLNRDLESALAQEKSAREQLIQAEKLSALGRMVGSVAHELNNPLQTITNCFYLADQELTPDSPIHTYLEMAQSETLRLVNLVAQLRELYRMRPTGGFQALPVAQLLGDVQTLMAASLENAHVRWQQPEALPDGWVKAAPERLKQVFINLATNAVQAMQPAGGVLWVGLAPSADGQQIGVSFHDTGPGIKPEHIGRLFEPFFTTKEQGMGLGLSICHEIVQQHGGQITVASQPGQGAEFIVWLPVAVTGEA